MEEDTVGLLFISYCFNLKADYRCICENGYKLSSDKENPTCIDLNECEQHPCHPGVDCINLPGSFMCSGCPKGLYGILYFIYFVEMS